MAQTITPLRRRMLDDMKLRNMAAGTRRSYVHSVAGFSAFHGRSPDELTLEDVRDYQLHLVARGLKASSIWTQTVMKVDRGPPPYRGRRSA
jgi:integrase/recombinase XerD